VVRLTAPIPIRFNEAIAVAVLGLLVNLVSAWMLHDEGHHDHNLRSAYFHVLTDALTSVLAIVGLLAGRFYGWFWMDPLMGIVGGVIIARWSWGLLRGAGAVLLDTMPDKALSDRIRQSLEQGSDRVSDLHLWRIGPGHMAVIVSLISDRPRAPEHYKAMLSGLPQLSHVTVEVYPCQHARQAA
jgi:cation diffusion facilitator family transporter